MNNQQFRNLLLSNAKKDSKDGTPNSSTPSTRPSSTPALGSRSRSSIPMTPRQLSGRSNAQSEFARQLAERNGIKPPPTKKFKSSAPKGVKLAAGYTDRTKTRPGEDDEDEEQDEIAQRVKKLEEAMKLGQMDRETFEALVLEITGGDIKRTHLVKGLDRKLLEKVRQGEVNLDEIDKPVKALESEEESEVDDDAFEELEEREIAPVVKEKVEKKGERAPVMAPPPIAGVKRSRDQILAELKAQRKAAAEAAAAEYEKKYPTLGPGFRKVGPGGETTRIEIDERGREVLIITGADGKEKRKVRKQKLEEPKLEPRFDIENPDKPLQIPDLPEPPKEESDDEDIFEGVGADYNPLADLNDDDEDASSEEEGEAQAEGAATREVKPSKTPDANTDDTAGAAESEAESEEKGELPSSKATSTPALPSQTSASTSTTAPLPRRNYFTTTEKEQQAKQTDSADATVQAALAKVRTLDPTTSTLLADTQEARLAKRAAELAGRDRDMDDMDMGFGESRFDDADEMEMEGQKVKLSEWKGLGAGEEDDDEGAGKGRGGGKKERKRGGKKKKGDKNSAADVLKVMERQKGAKTLG